MGKLVPLAGFVLAEPLDDDLQANGGIYIPETTKDKPAKATVLAVGEDTTDIDLSWCKVGQTIIHKQWSPTRIKDKGKEVVFVAASDILGYEE